MMRLLVSAGNGSSAGLSDDSDTNELPLIAGGAVDGAARLLVRGRSHVGGPIAKGHRDHAALLARLASQAVAVRTHDFDGSEHGVDPRFTIASTVSLKSVLLKPPPVQR